MTAPIRCASTHHVGAASEYDRSRKAPGCRHRRVGYPSLCSGVEPQRAIEHRSFSLLFAAKVIDGAGQHGGAAGAACIHRCARCPRVGGVVINVDVAEIAGSASPADRHQSAAGNDRRGTAHAARQFRARRPRVQLRIENAMVIDRRDRVAAANDMNPAIEHNRRMPTARRGQWRSRRPFFGSRVEAMHVRNWPIGCGAEAADQENHIADCGGGRRVEALSWKCRVVLPLATVESLDIEHRLAVWPGSR